MATAVPHMMHLYIGNEQYHEPSTITKDLPPKTWPLAFRGHFIGIGGLPFTFLK
jgi:hypothetical protein